MWIFDNFTYIPFSRQDWGWGKGKGGASAGALTQPVPGNGGEKEDDGRLYWQQLRPSCWQDTGALESVQVHRLPADTAGEFGSLRLEGQRETYGLLLILWAFITCLCGQKVNGIILHINIWGVSLAYFCLFVSKGTRDHRTALWAR